MLRLNVLLLGLIGGMGLASTDIYIPALPKFAQFYGVSTYLMNLTLTVYLIFTGMGTLVFLKLSRIFPSSTLNLIFLLLFIFGGILISANDSYCFIMVGRGLQGLGFGVVNANIISFIRKSDGKRFAKNMATYSLSAEFVCLMTPLMGVFLLENIGWRAPFLYIATLAFVMMLLSTKIFQKKDQFPIEIPAIPYKSSRALLKKDSKFWIYNFVSFLLSGLGWALIAISPYFFEKEGFSDWFHGIFYMIYTLHYMLGNFILERSPHEFRPKLEDMALVLMGICSFLFLVTAYLGSSSFFIAAMMLLGILSGMLYGVVFEKAQQNLGRENERLLNSATTIMLLSRLLASGTFTAVVSWIFTKDNSLSFLFGFGVTLFIATLLFVGRTRPQKLLPEHQEDKVVTMKDAA